MGIAYVPQVHLQVGCLKFITQVPQNNMLSVSGQPPKAYLITDWAKRKSNNSAVFWMRRNLVGWHAYLFTILRRKWTHEWSLRMLRVHTCMFRIVAADATPPPMSRRPCGRALPLQLHWALGTGWEGIFYPEAAVASRREGRKCSTYDLGLSTGRSYI